MMKHTWKILHFHWMPQNLISSLLLPLPSATSKMLITEDGDSRFCNLTHEILKDLSYSLHNPLHTTYYTLSFYIGKSGKVSSLCTWLPCWDHKSLLNEAHCQCCSSQLWRACFNHTSIVCISVIYCKICTVWPVYNKFSNVIIRLISELPWYELCEYII